MQGPLVSILIPVYNSEGTIAMAIESCLKQTYTNIEILILDDASTDLTLQNIKQHPKVKLLRHDSNLGIPSARNSLLKASRGDYIAWLDADDRMLPFRIERQVKFMLENPTIDIAGTWILTDNPLFPKKKLPTENAIITAHLWFKNCIAQPSIISKNFYSCEEVFYNTDFYYMQDYELWFRLRNKKVFANIPEYLTCYHVSSNIETERKHKRFHNLQIPDKLWKVKWNETDFNIEEQQKESLQLFLSTSSRINTKNADELKLILNKMIENKLFGSVKENVMMIHFYRLLIFKRLSFLNKLVNISLLKSLTKFWLMKRKFLIQ